MDLEDFICPGFEKGDPEIIEINPNEDEDFYDDEYSGDDSCC